jgi:hypothetical protein
MEPIGCERWRFTPRSSAAIDDGSFRRTSKGSNHFCEIFHISQAPGSNQYKGGEKRKRNNRDTKYHDK